MHDMVKKKSDMAIRWLPVIGLCALIFIQSSFPSPDVGPDFPLKDKLLHFVVYAVLSALIVRGFGLCAGNFSRNAGMLILGIALATAYGISDEWHQSFVFGRSADPEDVLADFAGAVSGAVLFLWFWKNYKTGRVLLFLD